MPSPGLRLDLTPEGLEPYRETWRRRRAEEGNQRLQRRERAWRVAAACAGVLRAEFGATRVAVYGSLARATSGLHSDIDLAVWGLAPGDYIDAVARLLDVAEDFDVDLAMYERCRDSLRLAIDREGIDVT